MTPTSAQTSAPDHSSGTWRTDHPGTARAERYLRTALGANAAFSAASGAGAIVAAATIGERLDVDTAIICVAGAVLVGFAAAVLAIRRVEYRGRLRAWALAVSIADIGWVLGTVLVITAGLTAGATALIAIAVVVGLLAAAQLHFRASSA
ncbi:MAG: hypothetical protein AAGF73_07930 [Actinomycetota bacterium]